MKIFAVYIITNDGRPMMSKVYQSPKNLPDDTLLSGLLTTIQIVSSDLANQPNAARKFAFKGITYHLRNFGLFHMALVTADDDLPSRIMNKIGWKFIQNYGEKIPEWNGGLHEFEGFDDELNRIISKHSLADQSGSLEPSKKLDTVNLLRLPKELKNIAKGILTIGQGTIKDICEYTQISEEEAMDKIEKLLKEGYIGYFTSNDKKVFFC